jgi:RHS repeat-associated protein
MKLASSDPLPETAPEPVAAETSEKVVPSFATETSTPSNTAFLQAIYFLLLLQNKSAEGAYYYITDHLGAPQVITDDSGSVVWKAEYLPFGNVNILTADIENNLRFPGQYYDAETGLHYNWNRYYDPETGRYIAADPIGLGGGINLYAYVGGDPINAIDPTGELLFIAAAAYYGATYTGVMLGLDAALIGAVAWAAQDHSGVLDDTYLSESLHPREDYLLRWKDYGYPRDPKDYCPELKRIIDELNERIATRKKQMRLAGGGNMKVNKNLGNHPRRIRKVTAKRDTLQSHYDNYCKPCQ